jgi:hypothetical protein
MVYNGEGAQPRLYIGQGVEDKHGRVFLERIGASWG